MFHRIRLGACLHSARAAALPTLFVLLWSSGYIAGKVITRHGGPYTVLALRFTAATAIILTITLMTRAPWPHRLTDMGRTLVVGLLIQVLQFVGVYSGLRYGVSAGMAALIIGTVPLVTAALAVPLLGERQNRIQWLGFALGVLGVGIAVSNQLQLTSVAGIAFTLLGLAGLSLGTLYQRAIGNRVDLRVAISLQFLIAALVMWPLAIWLEGFQFDAAVPALEALGWAVLVNSIGVTLLFYWLIRRGGASRTASKFYLVPPTTALLGVILLGEALTLPVVAAFALTSFSVFLVNRQHKGTGLRPRTAHGTASH